MIYSPFPYTWGGPLPPSQELIDCLLYQTLWLCNSEIMPYPAILWKKIKFSKEQAMRWPQVNQKWLLLDMKRLFSHDLRLKKSNCHQMVATLVIFYKIFPPSREHFLPELGVTGSISNTVHLTRNWRGRIASECNDTSIMLNMQTSARVSWLAVFKLCTPLNQDVLSQSPVFISSSQ